MSSNVLLVGALFGISFELSFPSDGDIDLTGRNLFFLGQAVGDYNRCVAVEKVQDAVMDARDSGTQFVNSTPPEIGFRPRSS
jgi:hypothetical protein